MSNYAPINQQLSYTNSAPYSSSLLQKDVYKSQQNNINFSIESREEYTPHNTTNLANTVLRGIVEDNETSRLFFSQENINRIQKKIKVTVYERSQGKFKLEEDQDESDLVIVMRAVYLENCKNLLNQTVRQVKLLNDSTVKYLLPDLLTNIKQYYGYIRDISQPLTPMMRPMGTTNAGRRTLPSYTTLWKSYDKQG
jgi:hypothetical protein